MYDILIEVVLEIAVVSHVNVIGVDATSHFRHPRAIPSRFLLPRGRSDGSIGEISDKPLRRRSKYLVVDVGRHSGSIVDWGRVPSVQIKVIFKVLVFDAMI